MFKLPKQMSGEEAYRILKHSKENMLYIRRASWVPNLFVILYANDDFQPCIAYIVIINDTYEIVRLSNLLDDNDYEATDWEFGKLCSSYIGKVGGYYIDNTHQRQFINYFKVLTTSQDFDVSDEYTSSIYIDNVYIRSEDKYEI